MTPPLPHVAARARGLWPRFCQRHLFDYTPAATRMWLLIAAMGALALGWALTSLALQPAAQWWPVLAGLLLVALAALFPVHLPGTNHTVLVADVFVFTILCTLGVPAAVLAAGAEGLVGALRTGPRWSSRVSSPSAGMAAFAVCGAAYTLLRLLLQPLLGEWGLSADMASLLALCLVAVLPVMLTTGPLMHMVALKRGQRLRLADWFATSTWIAAMSLGSAFVAGLVHLNAQRFGSALMVVGAALAIVLALLLRLTMNRVEAERQAQQNLVTQAQAEAAVSQQRFAAAFSHAAIGMAIVEPSGAVLQANQALCLLLGRDVATLLGQSFSQFFNPGDAALFKRQVAEVLAGRAADFSMELRCQHQSGDDLWVALHCGRYEDQQGSGDGLIYQLLDITSRQLAESRLHHVAYHDGLTDLANRSCFQERLGLAVERSRLDASERFAVLFLDLDRFKIVNDSLGHLAGNQLLREVAQRLRTCVRPGDLVARLGGDEFAILLETLHDADSGLRLAERVLRGLSQAVAINGTEVIPGASVGITFSDLGYRTVDEVLRDADLAMYEAKAAGRGRVVLFDTSMHERVAEKLALEADLRHAIGEGQLSINFQPIYALEPYRLSGFEALARWVHPTRGPISPAVFIALAEESGHIEALTSWVIDHSVKQLAEWHRQAPHMAHLGMHVNISGRDLARPDLVSWVQAVLQKYALPAHKLTLEITETTLMGKLDVALVTMGELRQMGVLFSIDDFGTGYSSLAYLSRLPIDSLKIDRSFVMGLHENAQNVEIVRAVLNLGQSLGRKVIAEGIETVEQLATLRGLGVPFGQGYLMSRPLRAEQVPALLWVGEAAVVG